MIAVAMLGGLVALILLSVPIAIALGVVAIVTSASVSGTGRLVNVPLIMYEAATSFPLVAIPLFIAAGAIMNASGISRRLIDFASALLGFIRGGLAMINIGVSMLFAEISGSSVADVAAVGSVLIPAMKKKGYTKEFAAAVTSSSASIAVIIPPSLTMILYGVMSGTSVTQLFVAGIVPGVLAGSLMMLVAYGFARRYGWPVEQAFAWRRLWQATRNAGWALMLPVIVLGGIFSGLVTVTEAAGLAVAAALFIGLVIHREMEWRSVHKALLDGGVQTAVVMLLVASSALIGAFLTEQRIPQAIAASIAAFTDNRYVILALLNVFFLVVGMFLHAAPAVILTVPIVMPLVIMAGIDPVHFGLIITLNLAIGQQTPPVASVLITACAIARADIWRVTLVNSWFIGVLFSVLMLVTYVPAVPMSLVWYFYR